MSNLVSWFIIAALGLGLGASTLVSYLGTGTSTRYRNYPRIIKTTTRSGSTFIRTGSTGGGSSRIGGGPSSGK